MHIEKSKVVKTLPFGPQFSETVGREFESPPAYDPFNDLEEPEER
jgi:hypothetical protein